MPERLSEELQTAVFAHTVLHFEHPECHFQITYFHCYVSHVIFWRVCKRIMWKWKKSWSNSCNFGPVENFTYYLNLFYCVSKPLNASKISNRCQSVFIKLSLKSLKAHCTHLGAVCEVPTLTVHSKYPSVQVVLRHIQPPKMFNFPCMYGTWEIYHNEYLMWRST